MRFVFYTNSVSAHQLPLARELVARLGADNYRYVYTGECQGGGQEVASREPWIVQASECDNLEQLLLEADVLFTGLRELGLFERRLALGRRTIYYSERWLKPHTIIHFHLPWGVWMVKLPGWVRLLKGGYRAMVRKFAAILANPQFSYLPVGKWAQTDMEFLLRRCARLLDSQVAELSSRFIPWGYFVEPSTQPPPPTPQPDSHEVRVLWVGRMLDWKRVDTLIRAIAHLNSQPSTLNPQPSTSSTHLHLYTAKNSTPTHTPNTTPPPMAYTLTLVGSGPEKPYLQKLAASLSTSTPLHGKSTIKKEHTTVHLHLESTPISFLPPVSLSEVRTLMRTHDVYVLASDGEEGWGAALNEAMEEGMKVLGTFEAGAGASMLSESHLFHAGDWRGLARLLLSSADLKPSPIGEWSAYNAALRMLKLINIQ